MLPGSRGRSSLLTSRTKSADENLSPPHPGRIPAGSACLEPAMTIDLFPTIAAAAGAELPRHAIDGRDLAPLFRGGRTPREESWYYWARELQAVRIGRWKLHLPHDYRSLDGRPGGTGGIPAKYVQKRIELSLFDIQPVDVVELDGNPARLHVRVVAPRLEAAGKLLVPAQVREPRALRASLSLHAHDPCGPLPLPYFFPFSVYGECRWTGAALARTRRLIISTKIENPIAK